MKLLNYNEVAEVLGVSRATVERMVLRGQFIQPLHITSGTVRFDADELDAWLAARPRSNPAPARAPRAK